MPKVEHDMELCNKMELKHSAEKANMDPEVGAPRVPNNDMKAVRREKAELEDKAHADLVAEDNEEE